MQNSNFKLALISPLRFLHRGRQKRLPMLFTRWKWHLSQYPDVRAAIQSGLCTSAEDHYRLHGILEKRLPSKPVVNEAWYLQAYPDVAQAIREGRETSAYDHFVKYGYREGRAPFAGYGIMQHPLAKGSV